MATLIDVNTSDMSLSELVSLVLAGAEVILTEGQEPLARLLPVQSKRRAGLHEGAMRIADDFTAPLPDTFWTTGE